MKNGFKVLDSDLHVIESGDVYERYLDERFRDRAPRYMGLGPTNFPWWLVDGKPIPKTIELKPAKLAAATYVAEDAPNLWSWVIFPRGFRAPALMELAKRQAWTLKPAILDPAR